MLIWANTLVHNKGYCAAIAYPGQCTNEALHQYNCIVGVMQQKFCVDAGSYSVGGRVEDGLLEALLKEFFQMQEVQCVATRIDS